MATKANVLKEQWPWQQIHSRNNDHGSKCIQGTMIMTINIFEEQWTWQQIYSTSWIWQQMYWRSNDHERKYIKWIMNITASVFNEQGKWQQTNLRNNDQICKRIQRTLIMTANEFTEQWIHRTMTIAGHAFNDHGSKCIQWTITMAANIFNEQ